jgi:hypothetical protein
MGRKGRRMRGDVPRKREVIFEWAFVKGWFSIKILTGKLRGGLGRG